MQALVNTARKLEEMRLSLIQNCEKHREYLAEWLENNKDFGPMGPEHEDIPVRWEHFVKKTSGSMDTARDGSEAVEVRQQEDDTA